MARAGSKGKSFDPGRRGDQWLRTGEGDGAQRAVAGIGLGKQISGNAWLITEICGGEDVFNVSSFGLSSVSTHTALRGR
jgi:hypothetical protein